jgi:hypothetical protein
MFSEVWQRIKCKKNVIITKLYRFTVKLTLIIIKSVLTRNAY